MVVAAPTNHTPPRAGVSVWRNEARITQAHADTLAQLIEDADLTLPAGDFETGPTYDTTVTGLTQQDVRGVGDMLSFEAVGEGSFQTAPEFVNSKLVFDADGALVSTIGPLAKSLAIPGEGTVYLGGNPCFWLVMRFQSAPGTSDTFSACSFVGRTADPAFTFAKTGVDVTLTGTYYAIGATTVTIPLSNFDDSLRLYSGRMEGTQLVLKIADTEFVQPLTLGVGQTGATMEGDVDVAVVGPGDDDAPMEIHEMVFTTDRPTDDQITRLETYFKRKYPTLATELNDGI
jgi:hypothetical protein